MSFENIFVRFYFDAKKNRLVLENLNNSSVNNFLMPMDIEYSKYSLQPCIVFYNKGDNAELLDISTEED